MIVTVKSVTSKMCICVCVIIFIYLTCIHNTLPCMYGIKSGGFFVVVVVICKQPWNQNNFTCYIKTTRSIKFKLTLIKCDMQCFTHLIVGLRAEQGTLPSWWKRSMLRGHSVFPVPLSYPVLSEASGSTACRYPLPWLGTKPCSVSTLFFFYSL